MILDVTNTIYDWVDAIINNPLNPPTPLVPIVPSYSNTPAPEGRYITIDSTPTMNEIGKADWEVIYDETEDKYFNYLRSEFEGAVEIWETNGNGDYLLTLSKNQWVQEAINKLSRNKISYKRDNGILFIPRQQGEQWERESVLEIIFGFGTGLRYEVDGIEDAEINGTITKDDGSDRNIYIDKDV